MNNLTGAVAQKIWVKQSYWVGFHEVESHYRKRDNGEDLTVYLTVCGKKLWDFDLSDNVKVVTKKPKTICPRCTQPPKGLEQEVE